MKIALYIDEGLEQVVLTPESKVETNLLGKIHADDRRLEVHKDRFYECRGGWVRQGPAGDESTILVLRPAPAEIQVGNNRPVTEAELDLLEAAQEWDDAQQGARYGPMHQELVRAERGLRDAISRLRSENDGRWRRP